MSKRVPSISYKYKFKGRIFFFKTSPLRKYINRVEKRSTSPSQPKIFVNTMENRKVKQVWTLLKGWNFSFSFFFPHSFCYFFSPFSKLYHPFYLFQIEMCQERVRTEGSSDTMLFRKSACRLSSTYLVVHCILQYQYTCVFSRLKC